MQAGIGLMYVEGEVQDGRLTGRTVLVIETTREIEPGRDGYSSRGLKRLVSAARAQWERRFEPADLVRLEYHAVSDLAPVPERRTYTR